jgi:hypothetical protein
MWTREESRGDWRCLRCKERHNLFFSQCTVVLGQQNKEGGMDETVVRMKEICI